jgi:hypothetical protein
MQEPYYNIFWNTVSKLSSELASEEGIGWLMNNLHNAYVSSPATGEIEIPDVDDCENDLLNLGGFRISKLIPPDRH